MIFNARWRFVFLPVLFFVFGATAHALPVISAIGEPVLIGSTAIITGEGFAPGVTKIKVLAVKTVKNSPDQELTDLLGKNPELPKTPPNTALSAKILKMTDQIMACQLLIPGDPGGIRTLIFWVGDGKQWSAPYAVNMPEIWFLTPSLARPGESVRACGRNFKTTGDRGLGYTKVILKSEAGEKILISDLEERDYTAGTVDNYIVNFKLPENLKPGHYSVFVHNGSAGSFGLSNEAEINILEVEKTVRNYLDVREFGALGNGVVDDTTAVKKAVQAAKDKGSPATVVFPAGKFLISETITIPAGISIQGVGKEATTISNNPGGFSKTGDSKVVETIKQITAYQPEGNTYLPLIILESDSIVSDIGFLWNSSAESGTTIAIAGKESKNILLTRIKIVNIGEVYKRGGKTLSTWSSGITGGSIENFELSHSEIEAFFPIFFNGIKNSSIRYNRITSHYYKGHPICIWGAENCLFEHNYIYSSDKGFVFQNTTGLPGHGNVHNILASNCVEDIIGNVNSCETYLWEFSGNGFLDTITSVDSRKVVFGETRMQDNKYRDYYCVIVGGRGLGQYRRIISNDLLSVQIDRDWNVPPDASSTAVVMKGTVENVLVNNIDRNNDKGSMFYSAGAIGNVIDRQISLNTNGIGIWTLDASYEKTKSKRMLAPDYYNTVMNCKVVDQGGIQLTIMGHSPLAGTASSLYPCLGNHLIFNEVVNVSKKPASFYWPHWQHPKFYHPTRPAIGLYKASDDDPTIAGTIEPGEKAFFNIIEFNHIQNAAVGIVISPRSNSTILNQNSFFDVKTKILDKGKETVVIDAPEVEDRIDTQQDF